MKLFFTRLLFFIGMAIPCIGVKAQVVTVTNPTFTTPALAATYTSLANAINALNTITAISGPVTITLNTGNSETAPVGGYIINFTAATTALRTVTINGSAGIITANASLVSGSLTDAIFKIIGCDFVTIRSFIMQENPANITTAIATNDMTEWGVALLYASTSNGAQNNTISNNLIQLNKSYSNTFGIYSNTRHSSTVVTITADIINGTTAPNKGNNVNNNQIQNVNMGIAFIGSADAAFMDTDNEIGGPAIGFGNVITNWGGIAAGSIYISNSGSCYGIFMNNQKNETVSFNTITSATVSGTSVAMRGIFKTYGTVPTGTFTSDITNNIIRINHNFSSGVLDGIRSEGISSPLSTATININSNRFQNVSVLAASSSTSIVGITNTSQCGVLNINNNIFRATNSTATTGGFTAISNTGAVQTSVNINGNQIGDASGNAVTFSAATSAALIGITCPTIAAGAALSISNNNFQGFVQSIAGSGAHTYITYTHAANTATTDNINSNTFTNLVANTSADVNFILRSGTMAVLAGATNNCNNNNIVTGFSKPVAGGVVTLYNSSSGSLSGNSMIQTGNNFSNITIAGVTTMNGWSNTEGGVSGPTKTISNNIFNNWTCGTVAVTVLTSNFGDNNTIVSNNTISSISAAAAITGITLGINNKGTLQTCSGNNISDLSSTGGTVLGITGGSTSVATYNINNNTISGLFTSNASSSATGIRLLSAAVSNVFKNKIYNISCNNATATVNGMDVQGTVSGIFNISNNLIGDLRADLTNSTNAIRGINLLSVVASTAYNVFYNTVYINALAGGTNFGTSAISATVSATAANGALNLRNNILVNTSLAKGTGLTVAYRRSGTALNNFTNSSNNNIFYAGSPSATNLIFTDGTNFDQTLAAYQSRVTPRDAVSFTELPTFLSTVGSSANFLHLDPFINTQAENGAVNIATYTDDFDGDVRQGNVGYGGSGTAPDIGADEINAAVVVVTNFNLTTPALSPTYASLASAITALNAVSSMANGTVTLTLMPGNAQTAPVGGYTINTTVTTSTKLVIITGSNNTITANGSLVAGTLTDAIFKVVGVDFLTLQNFIMQENPANTTTAVATNNMTEWGVALLYASATNGAQDNTIQNNTISLNKTYSNTFGIYSNTRHTPTVTGTIAEVTSTAGANSNNDIYSNAISNVNMGIAFIGSGNDSFMDLGNDIGGASVTTANTITNWGGIAALSNYVSVSSTICNGIYLSNQKNENVSFNTITSATVSGAPVGMIGIYKAYSFSPTGTFTSSITNNVIGINQNFTSGLLEGIRTDGISTPLSTATININNNRFQNMSVLAATSSTNMFGIINNSNCGVLNINNNIFRGNTSTATTGDFTAIRNIGAVRTTVNINGNQIGDASGNAITFTAATSGVLTGINCSNIASGASLSISNNNFQGFVQSAIGSGAHNYINYSHFTNTATTDNINNNTFTNLVANTSGSVTFINRFNNMAVNAGHTENCNFNSIVTGFSKPVAGGTVSLYRAALITAFSGNTMVQNGNNFSNITLTGATSMDGWNNSVGASASGPTKIITNNVFSNWSCGTSVVNVIQSDLGDNGTTINNNTISNISAAAEIFGILLGSSNKGTLQTCSGNTITGLSSTGGIVEGIRGGSTTVTSFDITNNKINGLSTSLAGSSVSAITMITASTANLFKNKIYDLSTSNAAANVIGINVAGAAIGTYNISNNLVGDLRADLTNSTVAISGMYLSSVTAGTTYNVFYNTVYLNALSGGTDFGTSVIYAVASSTAANGALNLRNNILVNTSLAKGTGLTVAYRRSSAALNNYDISSNNNIFYAGTPSTTNLIFTNGTNNDQTLAAYKTRVGPTRDAASFTEMPPFLSTIGSSPDFLHLDPNASTQAESGAVSIATYTDDFDGESRQGFTGYAGVGTAPDIGADEIANETNSPVITYTTISSPICIFSGMTISAVVIKDSSGIPLSGALVPRIYFRKNAGAWFSAAGTNTGGTAKNSTWQFTIVEASMGGVVVGDVVSYYVIAQDIMPTTNVGANPGAGLVATNVNTVTTAPTTPNTYTISGSLNGLYTVGVGGNFTTLTAAVAAYNSACSLAGPVIFELIDNLYTNPISINNHIDASAIKTLTIRPSVTATPLITAASASHIIRLNGAKHIIFDGRQGGTGSVKSMTISNTGTASTILFQNDAQNSIVKFCIVQGQSTGFNAGTIFFSTANVAGTGNDNNTIDNNDITDATSQPVYGVYSAGTASRENDNISISNNNISNYYNQTNPSAGIYINSNSSGWTITGNRLFQTAPRLYNTNSYSNFGIFINSGNGYNISNNVIGFANEAGTGITSMLCHSVLLPGFPTSYTVTGSFVEISYFGIYASFSTGGIASAIDGNHIGGIAFLSGKKGSFFSGIAINSGTANIGTLAGNIIGSETGTNSIYAVNSTTDKIRGGTVTGIYTNCSGNAAIQNNKIGGILVSSAADTIATNFVAIHNDGTANYTISNNSIGNTDANNLQIGYAKTGGFLSNAGTLSATAGFGDLIAFNYNSGFYGILSSATGNSISITGNNLRGFYSSRTGFGWSKGIFLTETLTGINPSVNISNNNFGTATSNWCDFAFTNLFYSTAIMQINNSVTTTTISGNNFSGASTISTGTTYMIEQGGNAVANSNININNNSFTNLSLLSNAVSCIYTYSDLTATSKRVIDNNRVVGNLITSGGVRFIESAGIAVAGSQVSITNNNFSNVSAPSSSTESTGIREYSGGVPINGFPLKKINNNTFSFWAIGGLASVIEVVNMGSMLGQSDSICNNLISNINTGDGVIGISSGYSNLIYGNAASVIEISNNVLSGCSSGVSAFGSAGIYVETSNLNSKTFVRKNSISAFTNTGTNNYTYGIVLGPGGNNIDVCHNRIYDIFGRGNGTNGTIVSGISTGFDAALGGGAAINVNIYNNLVGDLRATITGSTIFPAVVGINLVGGGDSLHVFNNTVNINSSNANSNSFFSTAALFTNTTANSFVRNNIFNNTSTPGSSGFTVGHWRSGTLLGAYSTQSNNNLFYAGTPTGRRFIYYNGTNTDQTLAAYKTRLGVVRESASVTEQPVFLSIIGANPNFLHLDPSANCGSLAKGDNSVHLLSADFDNDTRMTVAPFIIDIGADETSKLNIWTGSSSTVWNNSGNWSTGIVPNSTDRTVYIPAAPINQPRIGVGEIFEVKNMVVATGASLLNSGTLKIAGVISGAAASINNISAGLVTGSIEINRPCANVQVLAGNVFTNNAVKNFKINNDLTMSSVIGEGLNVSGELGFDAAAVSKTFNSGNNLVLVSTANATANVSDLTNNSIVGQATVERFINTGTTGGAHTKTWQFLSTPTTGQTIRQAWQENGTTPAGFGTIITGTGTGFDFTTALPSLKFFNDVAVNWTAVTNTNNALLNKLGYMLFVRGDRTVTTSGANPNNTVLRSKGTLFQPSNPLQWLPINSRHLVTHMHPG